MSVGKYSCPTCRTPLTLPDALPAGGHIKGQKCGPTLRLKAAPRPASAKAAPPPAEVGFDFASLREPSSPTAEKRPVASATAPPASEPAPADLAFAFGSLTAP